MTPSLVPRPSRLAAEAWPFTRSSSIARSTSPSASTRAALLSIIAAPVRSRSAFTSAAVTCAIRSPLSGYRFSRCPVPRERSRRPERPRLWEPPGPERPRERLSEERPEPGQPAAPGRLSEERPGQERTAARERRAEPEPELSPRRRLRPPLSRPRPLWPPVWRAFCRRLFAFGAR